MDDTNYCLEGFKLSLEFLFEKYATKYNSSIIFNFLSLYTQILLPKQN
jgi:hypothetical protein